MSDATKVAEYYDKILDEIIKKSSEADRELIFNAIADKVEALKKSNPNLSNFSKYLFAKLKDDVYGDLTDDMRRVITTGIKPVRESIEKTEGVRIHFGADHNKEIDEAMKALFEAVEADLNKKTATETEALGSFFGTDFSLFPDESTLAPPPITPTQPKEQTVPASKPSSTGRRAPVFQEKRAEIAPDKKAPDKKAPPPPPREGEKPNVPSSYTSSSQTDPAAASALDNLTTKNMQPEKAKPSSNSNIPSKTVQHTVQNKPATQGGGGAKSSGSSAPSSKQRWPNTPKAPSVRAPQTAPPPPSQTTVAAPPPKKAPPVVKSPSVASQPVVPPLKTDALLNKSPATPTSAPVPPPKVDVPKVVATLETPVEERPSAPTKLPISSFALRGEQPVSPKKLVMPPKKGSPKVLKGDLVSDENDTMPDVLEHNDMEPPTQEAMATLNNALKNVKRAQSPQANIPKESPKSQTPIASSKQVTPLIVESAEQHVNRMRTAPLEELPQVKALLEEAKAAEKAKIAEAQSHNTVLTTHLSSISELSDEIKSQQKASSTYKALQFMNLNRGGQTRDKQIKMLKNKINDLIGKTITIPPSLDYKGITEAMTVIEDIKKQILKSEGKNTKSKLVGICETIIKDLNDIKLYSKLVSETKPKEGKKEAP